MRNNILGAAIGAAVRQPVTGFHTQPLVGGLITLGHPKAKKKKQNKKKKKNKQTNKKKKKKKPNKQQQKNMIPQDTFKTLQSTSVFH